MKIQKYQFIRHFCLLLALVFLFELVLGWYMVGLDYYHPWYHDSLFYHKAVGMTGLFFLLFKISYSTVAVQKESDSPLKFISNMQVYSYHFLFFSIMFAVSMTGYAISASAGAPISIFGLFNFPSFFQADENLLKFITESHYYIAYGAVAVVGWHGIGKVKRRFR